jgi:predicted phosphoribosyltransferase
MIGSAFLDRRDAGRRLATKLERYRGAPNLIVLALPRGGVPVAYEVAQALGAPLDIFMVRKLGMPGNAELAMGAIATGGALVINEDVVRMLRIPPNWIDSVALREQRELVRRNAAYRGSRPVPSLRGRTVVLVDDGIATGSSMMVAVDAIRLQQPASIVVAAPVAAYESRKLMLPLVDDFVCVVAPYTLDGVARWYHDFRQTSDDEVRALLNAALRPEPGDAKQSESGRGT